MKLTCAAALIAVFAVAATNAATCGSDGKGVYNGDHTVCCLGSCGSCGGTGCDKRPGGATGCCVGTIQNSKKYCGTAPCLRPDYCSSSTTCKIPCGRNTEYGKPFEQGSTPDSTCCTAPGAGCYSVSYNSHATSCQVPVKCNTGAGETPCGHGGDVTPHLFTDRFCCKSGKKCVEDSSPGGTTSSCQ